MRKKTINFIALLIAAQLGLTPSLSLAASFSDVHENHKHFQAIGSLEEKGIISGYSDGTFRPNNKINRVEFLKIVLESSSVTLNVQTPTGFTDVDENAWYSAYLKKAKQEEWVSGYEDGTFKPAQNINKAEALKIIAEVQNWPLKKPSQISVMPYEDVQSEDWFLAYMDFAKTHELFSKNTSKVLPGQLLTRADTADLLFQSIEKNLTTFTSKTTTETKTENTESVSTKPDTQTETLDFNPVSFRSLSKNSFNAVVLKENFPNTFYKNELYYFEGQLTSKDNKVLVFVVDESSGEKKYNNHLGGVTNSNFSIPVKFKETGNFKIGIIPGTEGTSKVFNISVLPSLPSISQIQSNSPASDLKSTFKDEETLFSWTQNGNNIFKVNIWQNDSLVTYFNRQNKSGLKAVYRDFADFKEGKVYMQVDAAKISKQQPLEISSPWQSSTTLSFNATTHLKSDIEKEAVTLNNFQEVIGNKQKISVSGTLKVNSINEAAIIKPDGTIDKVPLKSSAATFQNFSYTLLPKNSGFSFEYQPTQSGTHIIEINKENGAASVNTPVYMGSVTPLIPDYFDLENDTLNTTPLNLKAGRTEMLSYINQFRQKFNLPTLTLDDSLNTLAQNHSKDMAENQFFSHVNLEGETPTDRRKKLDIKTDVGENLGKAPSIRFGHEGLIRSAIHRENILDKEWTKVGIGLSKDNQGYLYITQEFSHEPYTSAQLEIFESETLSAHNNKRLSLGLKAVVKNSTLDKIANALTKDIIAQKSITSSLLQEYFTRENITSKAAFLLNGSSPNNEKIIEETIKAIDISHSQWKEIGIKHALDEFGTLIFVILYTN